MNLTLIDKLMDFSDRHADVIAEQWFKSLSTNSRTLSCRVMPRDGLLRHAVTIYKAVGNMFFAENCFKEVEHVLDVSGFAEDFFARGVPLEDVLYALVLLRRHLWLFADSQAVFSSTVADIYNALDSINRVTLVFDYAMYIVARKFGEMRSRETPAIRSHPVLVK